ncbi:MAG: T9SS type A sorting domain-containing protein [Candidatus Paceibacterota bacterium]
MVTRYTAISFVELFLIGVLGRESMAQEVSKQEIETVYDEELVVAVKMDGWTFEVRQITITDYEVNPDGSLGKTSARFDFLLKTGWPGDAIEKNETVTFTMTGQNGDPDSTTFEFFLHMSGDPDDKLMEETVSVNHVVRTHVVAETGEYRFQVRGENGSFVGTEAYRTKIQVFTVGPVSSTLPPIAHDGTVQTQSGQRICVDLKQSQYVTAQTVPLAQLEDFLLITKPTQGSVTKVNGNPIPIYSPGTTDSGESVFDGILCYTPPSGFEGSLAHTWVVSDGEKTSNHGVLTVVVVGVATDIELDEEMPSKMVLKQNYPNPFNPTTTIEFALPKTTHVRLAVYNMLGQQVMQIFDEVRSVGSHQVTIEMSPESSSGVYLIRFESELGTRVLTMNLLK